MEEEGEGDDSVAITTVAQQSILEFLRTKDEQCVNELRESGDGAYGALQRLAQYFPLTSRYLAHAFEMSPTGLRSLWKVVLEDITVEPLEGEMISIHSSYASIVYGNPGSLAQGTTLVVSTRNVVKVAGVNAQQPMGAVVESYLDPTYPRPRKQGYIFNL